MLVHCTENVSFLDSLPHEVKLSQWLRRRLLPAAKHRKLDSCLAPLRCRGTSRPQGMDPKVGGAKGGVLSLRCVVPETGRASKRLLPRGLTPGRGNFHFEISVMPPLTKTPPKMVLPIKGVAFLMEAVFEKKFRVPIVLWVYVPA